MVRLMVRRERRRPRPASGDRVWVIGRRVLRRVARSRAVLWSVALSLGWSAAGHADRAERARRAWGSTRPVVVATHPIAEGHRLHSDDLRVRALPVAVVATDAIGDPRRLVGSVTRVAIAEGQPVAAGDVGGARRSITATRVGIDRRAVAIPTATARPPLERGDRVDLLAAVRPGDPVDAAGIVASDAEVVDVAEQRVTVAVAVPDAIAVAQALTAGAVVIALRGS